MEAETVVGRWVDTTLGQKGRGNGRAIPPQRGGWRDRFVVSIAAVAVVLAAVGGLTSASASTGVVLVVDSTVDAVDAAPGDGACATAALVSCTLRAAIQESNALPGADTITLPAGMYELAIPPLNQNLADNGDLDVTDSVTVNGAGAGVEHRRRRHTGCRRAAARPRARSALRGRSGRRPGRLRRGSPSATAMPRSTAALS